MSRFDVLIEMIEGCRAPDSMTTRIVAIDGLGGAGKTTLAQEIADRFVGVQIIHTDDFASWENNLDWWPRLLKQVIEPLRTNRPARYQRYDWYRHELGEWVDVAPGGLVLLEGVSSSRQVFRAALALTVWVETPKEERLRRGLARDGEEMREYWEQWMRDEDQYCHAERPDSRAQLVLDGTSQRW